MVSPERIKQIQSEFPGNALNNTRVVCFSCNEKGHYANACPKKAKRTAENAAGHDKLAMSREERLFDKVARLNEDSKNPSAA